MTERVQLRQAIRDQHGLGSTHLRSERIRETVRGGTVWDGIVEVFTLHGHRKARVAFAWSDETGEGGRRYVAVLRIPPIRNARDAVRASVAAEPPQKKGTRP